MRVINPTYEIISDISDFSKQLEEIGRVCYKSEDKITEDSSKEFISRIVISGHHSVLEHKSITVKFVHNRGFSHELVRHRIASYSQESTRYANYSKDKFGNELTFIVPYWLTKSDIDNENAKMIWKQTMEEIEISYLALTQQCNLQAQAARGILPNDLKTEIIMTANLREWIKVFELRCSSAAHPDMRRIMIPLCMQFQEFMPEIFKIEKFVGA